MTDEIHDKMDVSYIKKQSYKDDSNKIMSIKDNEYNYRINLKTEEDLDRESADIIVLLKDWKDNKKYFRYKKRISFVTEDSQFQIDITAVKSSTYNKVLKQYDLFKTFKESNILNQKEIYELEIEYIGNNDIKLVKKDNIYTSPLMLEVANDVQLEEVPVIEEDVNLNELYKSLQLVVYDINCFIYNTKLLISKSEKNDVLESLPKLK